MSQPTESPWEAKQSGEWGTVPGNHVYAVYSDNYMVADYMTEADARLTAAAPDLLAACEEAEKFRGMTGHPTWLKLRDAIAKATGRRP